MISVSSLHRAPWRVVGARSQTPPEHNARLVMLLDPGTVTCSFYGAGRRNNLNESGVGSRPEA